MSSTFDDLWCIPSAAIVGFCLQKLFGVTFILAKHSEKHAFLSYRVSAVTLILLFADMIMCLMDLDLTASPNSDKAALSNLPIGLAFCNAISGSLLLIVLYKRLGVFQKKESFGYKLMVVGIILTLICRILNLIIAVICSLSPSGYASCPQVRQLAIAAMLSNTLDAIVFIAATVLFLVYIASKLGVTSTLYKSIFMEFDGLDYIILVALKLYVLYCGFAIISVGKMDNITKPAVSLVPGAMVYELFTFVSASYECPQILLNTSQKSFGPSHVSATNPSRQSKKIDQERGASAIKIEILARYKLHIITLAKDLQFFC